MGISVPSIDGVIVEVVGEFTWLANGSDPALSCFVDALPYNSSQPNAEFFNLLFNLLPSNNQVASPMNNEIPTLKNSGIQAYNNNQNSGIPVYNNNQNSGIPSYNNYQNSGTPSFNNYQNYGNPSNNYQNSPG